MLVSNNVIFIFFSDEKTELRRYQGFCIKLFRPTFDLYALLKRGFSKTKLFDTLNISVLERGENKYLISTHQSQRLIVPFCSRLPEDSMMRSAYLRSDRFSIYWKLFKITNFSLSLYLYIQDICFGGYTAQLSWHIMIGYESSTLTLLPCTTRPDAKGEYNTNAVIIMTNTHHLDRLLCRDI